MAQMIYAVMTIMLMGLFALNMNRSMMQSQQQMVVNEVATQVTGIGTDIIEYIGGLPFDERTDESKVQPQPPQYPIITSASQLTPESEFGGCTEFTYTSGVENTWCDDLDDYHDLSFTRTVGDIEYDVSIEVRYVDPNTHEPTGGTRTFAKEVEVTIASPYLQLGSRPFSVTMSRVFTYNRHTQ